MLVLSFSYQSDSLSWRSTWNSELSSEHEKITACNRSFPFSAVISAINRYLTPVFGILPLLKQKEYTNKRRRRKQHKVVNPHICVLGESKCPHKHDMNR